VIIIFNYLNFFHYPNRWHCYYDIYGLRLLRRMGWFCYVPYFLTLSVFILNLKLFNLQLSVILLTYYCSYYSKLQTYVHQACIYLMYCGNFKGTLPRDFRPLVFFHQTTPPAWAPDARNKAFLNMASNSLRKSIKKSPILCTAVSMTPL
jgi:hypothetical protein